MVTREHAAAHARALVAGAVALALLLAGSTCKVLNEDHCANQDVPGNQFCSELNNATPYCSPCNREYHGCVDFEPFACPNYDNEVSEPEGGGSSEAGSSEGSQTESDTAGSTSDASSSDGSGSGSTAG
jgi:hypothetical protein